MLQEEKSKLTNNTIENITDIRVNKKFKSVMLDKHYQILKLIVTLVLSRPFGKLKIGNQ